MMEVKVTFMKRNLSMTLAKEMKWKQVEKNQEIFTIKKHASHVFSTKWQSEMYFLQIYIFAFKRLFPSARFVTLFRYKSQIVGGN